MHYLIALALGAGLLLGASPPEEHEEIRVQLITNSSLAPLYLAKFQIEGEERPPSFARDLEEILRFDLNHNGLSKVLPYDAEKEQLLLKEEKIAFNPKIWKELGIAHVIKGVLSANSLHLMVFSTQGGHLQHFREIPLSGHLNQDRRQIHKVADGIQKALFAVEGIANTRILYAVQVKNSSEIWECDWDGGNARPITQEGSRCVTPVFVPPQPQYASDHFLYVSYRIGQPKIYIASLKEGKGKRLISLPGNQLLPAISPKRDQIAFISDVAGRTDLFLQPFHVESGKLGKPVQLFSYPRATQASPTFHPDGTKIAFVSDKDGSPRIYTISTAFTGKRGHASLISKKNPESSCPAWSPDGRKLAYSARTKGTRQIWIYDFETREETQLTHGPGNKENPSWGKDSLHLVFNSTDASSSDLYIVNLNQPEAVKITQGAGKKHYPTWGTR